MILKRLIIKLKILKRLKMGIDLCGEDTDKLLDTLSVAYGTLNLKSIKIKTKD